MKFFALFVIFSGILFSLPGKGGNRVPEFLDWIKRFSNEACQAEIRGEKAIENLIGSYGSDILKGKVKINISRNQFSFLHKKWEEIEVGKVIRRGKHTVTQVQVNSLSPKGVLPKFLLRLDTKCQIILARELIYFSDGRLNSLNHLDASLKKITSTELMNPPVPKWFNRSKVRVAHIDTGINYLLKGVFERLARNERGEIIGWDFWEEDPFPFDIDFPRSPFFPIRHGTAVASIFLREAPNASIVPYRYPRKTMQKFSKIFDALAIANLKIVMLPMGSRSHKDWKEFRKMALKHSEILFIVSAGNDGVNIDEEPLFPASFSLKNMIVVTSSNNFGKLAKGSNWGKNSVDLMVPAERVEVIDHRGVKMKASGSSYAVPRIAALAARLWSKNPKWTINEIKKAVFDLAVKPLMRGGKRVRMGWIPNPLENY